MALSQDLVNIVDRYLINDDNVMPDVDHMIRYEDLDFLTMVTFMDSIGNTKRATDVRFRWPENRAETYQVTCSAIAAVGAGVEQTVTIKAGVVIGQELFHGSTKQTFIVTDFIDKSDDSSSPTGVASQVKIKKKPFTSVTVAITTPVLKVLALRTTTGGYYPVGQGSTPVWHYNYVQLCTNVASISGTEKNIQQWYGSQLRKDIREKIVQHKGNNSRVFWWGEGDDEYASLTNEDGRVSTGHLYSTQGVDDRITTHRTPYTVLDKQTILSWIGTHCFGARNSGPKRQLLVCGPDAMQAINEIGENQFVALPGTAELGLDIQQFKAWGNRSFAIVEEKEFYGDGTTAGKSNEAGTIYKLNPDNMEIHYLRPTFMEVSPIKDPMRDAEGVLMLTEWGTMMSHEQQAAKLFELQ